MKEKIFHLRNKGKTYTEICDALKISKSLVSYYLGKDQKKKQLNRNNKNRSKNSLTNKLGHYKSKKAFQQKVSDFAKVVGNRNRRSSQKFFAQDIIDKFGQITNCYLTGEIIDLKNHKNYALDHVIPVSKGGTCDFSNMRIATKAANQAKSNLMLEEFLDLCKKVLINFGYKISK